MATKKKKVGDKTPTNSHVVAVSAILEDVKKENSTGWNKLKIKALQIFLSACKYEEKKRIADKCYNELSRTTKTTSS